MARPRFTDDQRRFNLEHKQVIIDSNSCWIWQAAQNGMGYGKLLVRGVNILSHRYAYELFVGPIPEGLDIDHLCGVRLCCNPEHLEPTTRSTNVQRAHDRKKMGHVLQG